MATGMKRCKICGKDYEACHTQAFAAGVFRWQDVACCPEHGMQYLERVNAARGLGNAPAKDLATSSSEGAQETQTSSKKRSKKR